LTPSTLVDTPSEPIRAFVALRMSSEVEDALASFVEEMRGLASGIRWVRRTNLHLTLRFLGDAVDPQRLAALREKLTDIAAQTAPFVIDARRTGAFPNLGRPRVIWAGLAGNELVRLAARVEDAAVDAGFTRERRSYSPHLTIGRVRDPHGWPAARRAIESAAGREFGSSTCESMILYRSVLGPETSTYHEVARFSFSRPQS
jgi:RNA 2',3'-cyclic 3'-phosphodiesterase